MLLAIPNLEYLESEFAKFKEEYPNLEDRLNRYKTSASETISFASKEGITKADDAVRALFISDFIITSSEVPMGSDEQRHRSIFETFKYGQKNRCKSTDKLMQLYYLAYKTAILIRRQDLFMAGRGLDRKTSLVKLADAYVRPYLALSSKILGKGPCGWELGILAAALTKNFPDNYLIKLKNLPEFTFAEKITPTIWEILQSYALVKEIERNTNIVIPYVNESSSVLVLDPDKEFSEWGAKGKRKNDKKLLVDFNNKLKSLDSQKILCSFRFHVKGTEEKVILVRDPYNNRRPFFLLKTPASEINITEALTILNQRGNEYDGWLETIKAEKPKDIPNDKSEGKSTEEILVEKSIKEEKVEIKKVKQEKPAKTKSSGGFFAKIKSIFMKESEKEEKRVLKPKKETKEEKKITEEKKKRIMPKMAMIRKPKITLPPLAKVMTVDAVGDLQLYEIFDTLRESNYIIQLISEYTFEDKVIKTLSYKTDEFMPKKESVNKLLAEIQEQVGLLANHFFGIEELEPEEAFFIIKPKDTDTEEQRIVVSVAANEERSINVIAETFKKDIIDWQARRDKEDLVITRRTLHMRADQLLKSRRNIRHLDEAVERIFKEEIKLESMEWK